MTKWLQAAKQAIGADAVPEVPTQPAAMPVLSVLSVLSEGGTPDPAPLVATPPRSKPEPAPSARPEVIRGGFPYGTTCSLGDAPRTWTGRIVSLSDWRALSDWERHGPNGRLWCGLCRVWHMAGECEAGAESDTGADGRKETGK